MGDYNINYLENKEKQNLETIIQPYDLNHFAQFIFLPQNLARTK